MKTVLFLVVGAALVYCSGKESPLLLGRLRQDFDAAQYSGRGKGHGGGTCGKCRATWTSAYYKLTAHIQKAGAGIGDLLVRAQHGLLDTGSHEGNTIQIPWAPRGTAAAPSQVVALAPPCNLKQLNDEYVALLAFRRRRVSPRALAPRYDPVLFHGAFSFAQVLEREQSLRHDMAQPCAEICGTSSVALPANPKVLANFIWSSFANSPHHAAIQADERLVYVSAAATGHKFVVRLNYHLTAPGK